MLQRVMGSKYYKLPIFVFTCVILLSYAGCRRKLPDYASINHNVIINPDYSSISIPPNIAPLNFRIMEHGDEYIVRFHNSGGYEFIIRSGDGNVEIPGNKWSKLLTNSASKELLIDVFVRKSEKWQKFNTIKNYVTSDSIDKYLVYRLIEPGYVIWNKMGIYQRNLENFSESPVMVNSVSDGNCMNCHSFCRNNSNIMMFHMRGEHAGTIIYNNKTLSKINTKTSKTISPGVYPSWHPSGEYIAFSVNNIAQNFHSLPEKRIEVYDTLSDIIVYDVKRNVVATCENLSDPGMLETFPTWSPDGRELYFCSAKRMQVNQNEQIRYDIFKIAFDPENLSFGTADTVLFVSGKGKSVSFPRISPDGRFLLFCLSDYGNFSIWHPESDIWLLDLKTGKVSMPEINSNKTESYHSWSFTGRWIVFSSRREDGLYTRPYFSYFDSSGTAHKPFILPQKRPGFYFSFMKSYNIPELVTTRLELNPGKLTGMINRVPAAATFKGNGY